MNCPVADSLAHCDGNGWLLAVHRGHSRVDWVLDGYCVGIGWVLDVHSLPGQWNCMPVRRWTLHQMRGRWMCVSLQDPYGLYSNWLGTSRSPALHGC